MDASPSSRAADAPAAAPRPPRVGIFVVAYNAESAVRRTLERIPEEVWRRVEIVYVIDDASTDGTVGRALGFDRAPGKVAVLRNRAAQRYGGTQKLGLQFAIDRGLDVVALLHADGQYAPERLPDLLAPALAGEADVVLGSRMLEPGGARRGGMPRARYAGNRALTAIQNRLSGLRLSEFHSGYRVYRVALLRQVPFWENTDDWHFDTEVLLQARAAGARLVERPIPTYYGREIRHANAVRYGLNCLGVTLAFALHRRGVLYGRNYDIAIRGRRYHEKFDDPYSSHSRLWRRLEGEGLRGRRVLELGAGDAALTRRMHEAGALVDVVDVDAASASLAAPWSRRVWRSNLDDLDALMLEGPYDVLVAADVLEHLRDPEATLSRLKRHVRVGGRLAVSLPNVANLYVRLNLLLGRFPYHTKGILDRTHLHFFTLRSSRRLLERTGWIVEAADVTSIPVAIVFPFLRRAPLRWTLHVLAGLTRLLRGPLAYQGLYYARNPNTAELL